MRMLNPSLAVASLLGFLTAASCTLITDVDRTKIPTDAGPGTGGGAGDTGMGGAAAEAGTGATGGSDGGTNNGGRGGRGGNGGTAGTEAGAAGSDAGSPSNGGTGGSGTPTETCDKATGRITIGLGTLIDQTGSTFTLGDGVNNKVTFEFDWDDAPPALQGDNIIHFSGTPTTAELAVLITDAINNPALDLDITATTTAAGAGNGAGGAGGEGGVGANGAGAGQGGAAEPPTPMAETVELVNTRAGARGNVKITETVGNGNFKVSGMSGGKAVVCSDPTTSCSTDDECDAARTCSSAHICE